MVEECMAFFNGLLPPVLKFSGVLIGLVVAFSIFRLVSRMIRESGRG